MDHGATPEQAAQGPPLEPPQPRLVHPGSIRPRKTACQTDLAHLEPSRWWFASSAFPMIAGTLGPVASAFSICALVREWRQHLPPGENLASAVFVPDPIWLLVVNAVQLAMALVSNAFLLLNMAKRVRFSVAQPITIVGWYISAFCLVAVEVTFACELREIPDYPSREILWTQAFWYGVWAAILYFVVASLMSVTFWGASSGHYSKDFNLTHSQRTLMLQTIMVLGYLLLGALIFSRVEHWRFEDAVYYSTVTLFTVGFGDFSPQSNLGRALLMPYALVGIISLGLVVSSIRSLILERGKRRLNARMEEKGRRRTLKNLARKGKDHILNPLSHQHDANADDCGPEGELLDEFERRRREFELMRRIQLRASSRRRWMAMAISTSTWFMLWFVGALIFLKFESPYQPWTYYNAFYFCFISLTTIGYGDLTLNSNGGKTFFVFWSLLALPTMTVLISNAGETVVKFIRNATIRVGYVTILPSEEGFTRNLRHLGRRLTFGLAFKGLAKPLRAVEPPKGTDEKQGPFDAKLEGSSVSNGRPGRAESLQLGPRNSLAPINSADQSRRLARARDRLEQLPSGNDFRLLLIAEIQAISKHVHEPEPRRYSFDEWAWYLALMGEDERQPHTHHRAKHFAQDQEQNHKHKHKHKNHKHHKHGHGHARRDGHRDGGGGGDDDRGNGQDVRRDPEEEPPCPSSPEQAGPDAPFRWSWVGTRSPLMGIQEESQWIMERLMNRLRRSLWEAKEEEEQREADESS